MLFKQTILMRSARKIDRNVFQAPKSYWVTEELEGQDVLNGAPEKWLTWDMKLGNSLIKRPNLLRVLENGSTKIIAWYLSKTEVAL